MFIVLFHFHLPGNLSSKTTKWSGFCFTVISVDVVRSGMPNFGISYVFYDISIRHFWTGFHIHSSIPISCNNNDNDYNNNNSIVFTSIFLQITMAVANYFCHAVCYCLNWKYTVFLLLWILSCCYVHDALDINALSPE